MSKYRKSVIVNVIRPTKPLMLGDFSKIVFLTNEIDFDIKRYTTLEEVKTDFGATSKIYAGIEVFMSQADLDGNTFAPEYFCIAGKTAPDESFLEGLLKEQFYGVVIPFYNVDFLKTVQLWATRNIKFVVAVNTNGKTETPGILKESDRLLYLHGDTTINPLDIYGLQAYTFLQGINGRWKDRRVLGAEPSCNNSTLRTKLIDNNVNFTESQVGFNAVTSGSWCADGTTHADQRIKIDALIYAIETNLKLLMIQEKNLTMDGEGIAKVEARLQRVMTEMTKQGAIARDNNRNGMFRVVVPSIEDTSELTGLTVDDYINRVLRNVNVHFTISTEIENIDVTLVWHDEPLTTK